MKANLARGRMLGFLVACLGATTASCDGDTAPPPLTDLERGTMAATREEVCNEEPWGEFSVHESLGVLLSIFPAGHERGVDCTLAAHNCEEVEACIEFYRLDNDLYHDELHQLPECGSERTDRCEGNVAKFCKSDGPTLYEASYDCTLAGATCVEWQSESGERWADCKTPQLQCEGPDTQYCDGTRTVVCGDNGVSLSPWVYDCADAWGSHCVEFGNLAGCEGPMNGEQQCEDGIDGDSDGLVDCDDDDCYCETKCDDGYDNDDNGKVDCDDNNCKDSPNCQ